MSAVLDLAVPERFDIHAFADAGLYSYGTCLLTNKAFVEEVITSLLEYYSEIVVFFNQSAQAGDAVLLEMS